MVRVRFAPSPTGYLHIGGLRTALYNYLYAKQNNGKIILRIEDTDRNRMVKGAVNNLISTLEWSGIKFDEGPHVGGDYGPYTQSERLIIYKEHVNQLIDGGNAYPCFYSNERIESIKQKNIKGNIVAEYDRRYRDIEIKEMHERMREENHVVRLKIPSDGHIKIKDHIRGEIDFDLSLIQDQIIIKSDGYPTYHLASVIDDHLMNISHVIRGEEWIPSLPKHDLLYKSFNWESPQFVHLPLLLNNDKSKLSKRQGDVAVEDYIQKGYIQEAMINYVSLLGWHGSDNKEIYDINELLDSFSINRIKSSGAVFDINKLTWFNQEYIKNYDSILLKKLIEKSLTRDWDVQISMIDLLKDSVETVNDFENHLEPFFLYNSMVISNNNKLFSTEIFNFLEILRNELNVIDSMTADEFKLIVIDTKNKIDVNGNIWKPIRIALSGQEHGPDISKFAEIIGSNECTNRLSLFLKSNVH